MSLPEGKHRGSTAEWPLSQTLYRVGIDSSCTYTRIADSSSNIAQVLKPVTVDGSCDHHLMIPLKHDIGARDKTRPSPTTGLHKISNENEDHSRSFQQGRFEDIMRKVSGGDVQGSQTAKTNQPTSAAGYTCGHDASVKHPEEVTQDLERQARRLDGEDVSREGFDKLDADAVPSCVSGESDSAVLQPLRGVVTKRQPDPPASPRTENMGDPKPGEHLNAVSSVPASHAPLRPPRATFTSMHSKAQTSTNAEKAVPELVQAITPRSGLTHGKGNRSLRGKGSLEGKGKSTVPEAAGEVSHLATNQAQVQGLPSSNMLQRRPQQTYPNVKRRDLPGERTKSGGSGTRKDGKTATRKDGETGGAKQTSRLGKRTVPRPSEDESNRVQAINQTSSSANKATATQHPTPPHRPPHRPSIRAPAVSSKKLSHPELRHLRYQTSLLSPFKPLVPLNLRRETDLCLKRLLVPLGEVYSRRQPVAWLRLGHEKMRSSYS